MRIVQGSRRVLTFLPLAPTAVFAPSPTFSPYLRRCSFVTTMGFARSCLESVEVELSLAIVGRPCWAVPSVLRRPHCKMVLKLSS